jgi:hypothetical protein
LSAPPDSLVFFTDRDLGTRFPEILVSAGLTVRRHRELFPPDCSDDVWLEIVGKAGWIAVTHDARIRYKPNELAAVVRHGVRLLVVVGKAPFPDLGRHFVVTLPKITEFIEQHTAPWIAKVYRPQPHDIARGQNAPGSISLWYPSQRK